MNPLNNNMIIDILEENGYRIKRVVQSTKNRYQIFYIDKGKTKLNNVCIFNDVKLLSFDGFTVNIPDVIDVEKYIQKYRVKGGAISMTFDTVSPLFTLVFRDVVVEPSFEDIKNRARQIYYRENKNGRYYENWLNAHKQLLKEYNTL